MHSSRGLLKILSPTQIASIAPLASAMAAILIKSSGGVPRVTNARLDNVRPKVVFFCAMTPNISRARASFQPRSLVESVCGSCAPERFTPFFQIRIRPPASTNLCRV